MLRLGARDQSCLGYETSFDDCKNNEIDSKIIYDLGQTKTQLCSTLFFEYFIRSCT